MNIKNNIIDGLNWLGLHHGMMNRIFNLKEFKRHQEIANRFIRK